MSPSLADLFSRESDLASYRRAVLALGGDFPFGSADMIELGAAYFERYPDRTRDRDAAEVRLGYALARVAIVEKAVLAVDPARRDAYRTMFEDVLSVGPSLEALIASCGRAALRADHRAFAAALGRSQSHHRRDPQGPDQRSVSSAASPIYSTSCMSST